MHKWSTDMKSVWLRHPFVRARHRREVPRSFIQLNIAKVLYDVRRHTEREIFHRLKNFGGSSESLSMPHSSISSQLEVQRSDCLYLRNLSKVFVLVENLYFKSLKKRGHRLLYTLTVTVKGKNVQDFGTIRQDPAVALVPIP